MPHFPSLEWAEDLKAVANADEAFLATCKRYPEDDIILVCEEDEDLEETVCLYVQARKDGIAAVQELESPLDEEATFVITAPFGVWRRLIEDGGQTAFTVLQGNCEIEGDRTELLRRAKESQGLFQLLGKVDTTFPSE